MENFRPLAFLAAVSLVGCGGGGGGVSLGGPPLPQAPAPAADGSIPISGGSSDDDQLNAQFASQFSDNIQFSLGGSLQAQQDQAEEVYAPDTQSSLARAFAQAGQAEVVTGRTGSAYLIGDTTYGVAQAAQDFLAGAGLASDAYTFVDTGEGQTNRSAYLGTQENSVVNILSSPLYTSSSSGGLGGLIISPEDVNAHGWIISDTGFDGNIDPIAGISGRAWLGGNSASVAAGYRNALATGKVRLFYGLNADGESRNSSSNGCQGVEDHCIGVPYSLRIRNAQGNFIDVEGSFVSTYGFAAYVMAWERTASDTHISKVFEMGDACTVDLGENGADADTGLGRLDIGCLAREAYELRTGAAPVIMAIPDPVPPPPEPDPVVATMTVVDTSPANVQASYWNKKITPRTLEAEFKRLEISSVVNRKAKAYMIGHLAYKNRSQNPFEYWLYQYEFLGVLHNSAAVEKFPTFEWDFMRYMGLMSGTSYTYATVERRRPQGKRNYDDLYRNTAADSLVYFRSNPFYLGKPNFTGAGPWGMDKAIWLDAGLVSTGGWIVSESGFDIRYFLDNDYNSYSSYRYRHGGSPLGITDYRVRVGAEAQMKANYEQALATGKVRLFYGLNSDQDGRDPLFLNCANFEEYCIGVPHPYNSYYGFGVYLLAWERMPAATHISAVFDMGDRCTEDLGVTGPDADTGLGRLDIGCMAYEVYKVNLDASAATLTVAARTRTGSTAVPVSRGSLATIAQRNSGATKTSRQGSAYLIGGGKAAFIQQANEFLGATGLAASSYTFLDIDSDPPSAVAARGEYLRTQENSLVHILVNPLFTAGSKAWWAVAANEVASHGWILADTASDGSIDPIVGISTRRWVGGLYREEVANGYRQALATGKVRLVYDLTDDGTARLNGRNGCQGVENHCLGAVRAIHVMNSQGDLERKSAFGSTYAFAAYLTSWELMPEETHISAVFAMGDRCTEDLGADGPDADTGLGRLDIGCMANEVHKVNLDPASATLSVAARTSSQAAAIGSSSLLTAEGGNVRLQAQSAPPGYADVDDGTARQQFFNDFAQELFSHLGSLWLPGSTQAGFGVGFPGDSFEGTYRPTHGVGTHYDVEAPSPRYALSGGSVGVMGTASGEAGIFTRFEGMDISFSYARSEDFFGGQGSGDFGFASVGNSRLMVQRQMLAGMDDHSLVLGGWVRHAAVAGGKGRLLDDLRGSEYGLSMNYGWQRGGDGLKVEATAYAARFAGGEVELAGGNRFAIGASDWQWGVRIGGSYEF